MKNYETPKIDVIKVETSDIIQTSGTLIPGDNASIPGTGVTPGIPGQTSMDGTYNN